MSYSLGIDLGTTFTAAAVSRLDRVRVISLGNDRPAIPSVVLIREDGTILTGEAASRRAITEPEHIGREFKRRLGDPIPVLLGGAAYSAESLMARLLRSVLDDVHEREGGEPDQIAISHPANWGLYKIDLLRQALQIAGISNARLLTEPEAAAISYANDQRLETGQIIAVYDLGGGTFDAAVLKKTDDGFEILGEPVGIERLGGMDFDAAVLGHVTQFLGEKFTELPKDDPQAITAVARLRADCTSAREALSRDTDISIPVILPTITTEVTLTRVELESMIRPGLGDSIAALHQALESANVQPQDLHAVLLVGGSSRTPLVAQMVGAELGRPVAVDADPKHAVAIGAAHFAAMEHTTGSTPAEEPSAAVESEPEPPLTEEAEPSNADDDGAEIPEPQTVVNDSPAPELFAPGEKRNTLASMLQEPRKLLAVGIGAVVIASAVFAFTQRDSANDDNVNGSTTTSALGVDSTDPAAAVETTSTSLADTASVTPTPASDQVIRAIVDAGSVAMVEKLNPIIGTDDLQSTLTPPEYQPLRQLDAQIIAYVDIASTSNQQYYDFVTFQTTVPDVDPAVIWTTLAPAQWVATSPAVADSFESLGLTARAAVSGVSFDSAAAYCTYALKRLPTEIEWELAARDGLIDISTVQNWVKDPEQYGELPAESNVLRGSFGIEDLPLYFRTIGDTPTNRQNAGIRCTADDVIEAERPTGELLYVREFSGADEAHDWPDLHDPAIPEVAFGYHAPDVFHIEARTPVEVAVGSGTIQEDDTTIAGDVELRLPDPPGSDFRYGLIANATSDGYLALTVRDQIDPTGDRILLWCASRADGELISANLVSGIRDAPSNDCLIDGELPVDDVRSRLAITFSNGEASFSIDGTELAIVPEPLRDDATFGFILQNFEPGILSHAHYDNLALAN